MRLILALLLIPVIAFAAPQSVSIDTATKQVINPIVKFGSGNTLDGTGATITGFPGSSYSFAQSLLNTAGTVTLLNDSATPGNNKVYGTDGSGIRGWKNDPSGGSSTFIDLDFTGNNLTFMNGTTMWKSTGDSDDPVTFPYNATTSGIIIKDANNYEIFRLWADYKVTPGNDESTYIGRLSGSSITTGHGNTTLGSLTLQSVTTGADNTAIGWSAGGGVSGFPITGSNNVLIGSGTNLGDDLSGVVVIGTSAQGNGNNALAIGNGAYADGENAIAIGNDVFTPVDTNNIAVIGNSSVTDVYFGSVTALAKVHASNLVGGFTAHFSRGGAAIQANDVLVTPWTCPYSGTITGYSISADTGTCTLKTWKKANGTAIPTIADVISTSGVALSTGTHIRSSTVSDFTTTTVTAGDMFMAQVTATSGPTDITFQVEITR